MLEKEKQNMNYLKSTSEMAGSTLCRLYPFKKKRSS